MLELRVGIACWNRVLELRVSGGQISSRDLPDTAAYVFGSPFRNQKASRCAAWFLATGHLVAFHIAGAQLLSTIG